MRWIYTIFIMLISVVCSWFINLAGTEFDVDVYWTNTVVLICIVGVCAYYRYVEYEKNKGD